jgi:hypothetical protein
MWPRSYVRRDVKAEAYEEDGLLIEEHGDECD